VPRKSSSQFSPRARRRSVQRGRKRSVKGAEGFYQKLQRIGKTAAKRAKRTTQCIGNGATKEGGQKAKKIVFGRRVQINYV